MYDESLIKKSREPLLRLLPFLHSDFYLDDKKTKLLSHFGKTYHFSDELKFHNYVGVLGSIKHISDGKTKESTASGVSFERAEIALVKFIGESIERFSQEVYRKKDFRRYRYIDIRRKALDIGKLHVLTKKQLRTLNLKKFEFDENSLLNWVEGYELKTKKKTLIPAQLVYLSYRYVKEQIIYAPSTNGSAGGFSKTSALLRGIFEIVERDHFLISYLNKLSPPNIDLSSIKDKQIQDLIKKIKRYRFKIDLIDITLDLSIPTFLTVITDESGIGAAISLGLKTHFDINKAILGSITEAFLSRCYIRRALEDYGMELTKIKPTDIVTIRDRAAFWYPKKRIKEIQFITNGPKKKIRTSTLTKINEERILKKVMGIFEKNDMKVFYKDISLPQAKKIGYSVVKTVIPGMVPFYLDERIPYRGVKRLYEVPVKLGYRKHVNESDLNRIPHPFL